MHFLAIFSLICSVALKYLINALMKFIIRNFVRFVLTPAKMRHKVFVELPLEYDTC